MSFFRIVRHIVIVICILFLLAGLPIWMLLGSYFSGEAADSVSSASIELPDQPSGDFIVLINSSLHKNSLQDWRSFFTDDDFPIIFEDIKCLVSDGDVTGKQMAERYQLQLPENQMTLRTENGILLASKAEAGVIDVAVFSREMADYLKLSPDESKVTVINVSGGNS